MDKTSVGDKTQDKSQMNDTALHLDGSLFQESSTLRRVPSKLLGSQTHIIPEKFKYLCVISIACKMNMRQLWIDVI